jgi:hypothetical protein
VHLSRRWRRIGAQLLLGLALAVAACGTTTGGGTAPAPTPKPTATPNPIPCTAWRIIPSPDGTKWQENALSSVSALSPSVAWAVGASYGFGCPVSCPIERWDGTSWQVVASPVSTWLNGVAVVSPTDGWAVGSAGNAHEIAPKSVIERWNGTQWSVVFSPSPSATENYLSSVVALAANDVWAVGAYNVSNALLPLVVHWDGAARRVVATPTVSGLTESRLNVVARVPRRPAALDDLLYAEGSPRLRAALD